MHVGSDIRNTVAFIGYADDTAPGGIRCIGTGVLVHYKDAGYLVTARHVVEPIGDAPFLVRVNRQSRGSNTIRWDNVVWQYHNDETVDLAAIPFEATPNKGFECMFVQEKKVVSAEAAKKEEIGIGDFCYTVGLFRYMSGHERNEPVVFTGHIAMWDGKKIPIWNKFKNKKEMVDGHLVQSHGLQGASGSPVFARGSFAIRGLKTDTGKNLSTIVSADEMFVIGIMQGAWFLPPDEMLRAEINAAVGDTVPVGLGIITPSDKILELLEKKELREMREKNPPIGAATLTSVSSEKAPKAKDANPQHREDFTALLGEAARKQPQDD